MASQIISSCSASSSSADQSFVVRSYQAVAFAHLANIKLEAFTVCRVNLALLVGLGVRNMRFESRGHTLLFWTRWPKRNILVTLESAQ